MSEEQQVKIVHSKARWKHRGERRLQALSALKHTDEEESQHLVASLRAASSLNASSSANPLGGRLSPTGSSRSSRDSSTPSDSPIAAARTRKLHVSSPLSKATLNSVALSTAPNALRSSNSKLSAEERNEDLFRELTGVLEEIGGEEKVLLQNPLVSAGMTLRKNNRLRDESLMALERMHERFEVLYAQLRLFHDTHDEVIKRSATQRKLISSLRTQVREAQEKKRRLETMQARNERKVLDTASHLERHLATLVSERQTLDEQNRSKMELLVEAERLHAALRSRVDACGASEVLVRSTATGVARFAAPEGNQTEARNAATWIALLRKEILSPNAPIPKDRATVAVAAHRKKNVPPAVALLRHARQLSENARRTTADEMMSDDILNVDVEGLQSNVDRLANLVEMQRKTMDALLTERDSRIDKSTRDIASIERPDRTVAVSLVEEIRPDAHQLPTEKMTTSLGECV